MPGYGLADADEGKGLLPWSWAEVRLKQSHNYWFSSVRPEGRPHTMPVWGVWLSDSFVFSTGSQSRKALNLAVEANCTVAVESAAEAVVLEGRASLVTDTSDLKKISDVYQAKYGSGYPAESSVYRVVPTKVFGIVEASPGFTQSTTRWKARP
jgi:hypothetical protein